MVLEIPCDGPQELLFCSYVFLALLYLTTLFVDGYDHTNMTAPLPVRSAKLSLFGPGPSGKWWLRETAHGFDYLDYKKTES